MELRYDQIIVSWTDQVGSTTLRLHGITVSAALQKAYAWGYKEPRWYQFWRQPINVTCGLPLETVSATA
jgi:hypothetical protein